MNEQETMQAILERLPHPAVVGALTELRRHGWDWDDIEERIIGSVVHAVDDIDSPLSRLIVNEAERYGRRIVQAAYALETQCN